MGTRAKTTGDVHNIHLLGFPVLELRGAPFRRQAMNSRPGVFAALFAILTSAALFAVHSVRARVDAAASASRDRTAGPEATPVLVELFTSEGCSSCPPADMLLSQLGRTQPEPGANIIALEEHVDYWNDGGWKDPFSSDTATARQREYAGAFGGKEIYTPQMIVDGRAEFVGSSSSDALRAIRVASRTPKPAIHLAWQAADTLAVHMDPLRAEAPRGKLQLTVVLAESMLHSHVRHGENAGRALEHDGVVRRLTTIDEVEAERDGFSRTFPVHPSADWNRANLRAVIFVQEQSTRRVLAAASIPFPS